MNQLHLVAKNDHILLSRQFGEHQTVTIEKQDGKYSFNAYKNGVRDLGPQLCCDYEEARSLLAAYEIGWNLGVEDAKNGKW